MCTSDDDYESLPNSSLGMNMAAGAMAGIAEHTVTYPLDVLKTRMQLLSGNQIYTSISQSLGRIYTTEGMSSLWRGINTVILGSGPAHALYFGSYEACKEVFRSFDNTADKHLSHAAAGVFATLAHDGFMTPFDVLKQRMQINSSYRGMIDCASTVYRSEGIRAFYISYPVTVMMSMPFQVLQFTTYEYMKKRLNPSGQYNPLSHIVAGGVAGAVASSITNPLDVAKTLLQTRGQASDSALRHASGLAESFKLIHAREGFWGFTRGLRARVLSTVPSVAVSWTTVKLFNLVRILKNDDYNSKKCTECNKSSLKLWSPLFFHCL